MEKILSRLVVGLLLISPLAKASVDNTERDKQVNFFITAAQDLISQNAKDDATLGQALKNPSDVRKQYAARLNAIADQYGKSGGAFKAFYRQAAQTVLNANVHALSMVPVNDYMFKTRQEAIDRIATNGKYITNAKDLLARVQKLKAAMDASKDEDLAVAIYNQIHELTSNFSPFYDYTVYVKSTRTGFIDDEILVPPMRISLQDVIKTTGLCPAALIEASVDTILPTGGEEQFSRYKDLNTFSLVNDYKVMVALLDGPRGQGPVVAACPEASMFSYSFEFDDARGAIADTYREGDKKEWSNYIVPKVDSTELIQKMRALYNK